ncbi:MAG: hypothetical protein A2086_06895 [Spirochaetes bacterium GWD1_27_9]|nr:MAG: hypothetical protein A2Z98_14850 [Spirochaetes bacterium GWB1_27_13]OHD26942.1 MAG: hypothetical protein A2Y34_18610 [Spirochaetes bacterium GWC1_27_15]OHD35691.1 MAG: hypothetical protein A2086_06895 [Spirochaetes bacterium GWD1_27_9]
MKIKKLLSNYYKKEIEEIPYKENKAIIIYKNNLHQKFFQYVQSIAFYGITIALLVFGMFSYDNEKYIYITKDFILKRTKNIRKNFETNLFCLNKYLKDEIGDLK